jgi:hypothetical protein
MTATGKEKELPLVMIVRLQQTYKQIIDYIHYYRNNMKIKIEVEIDTENQQDLNTVEELVENVKELIERVQDEE